MSFPMYLYSGMMYPDDDSFSSFSDWSSTSSFLFDKDNYTSNSRVEYMLRVMTKENSYLRKFFSDLDKLYKDSINEYIININNRNKELEINSMLPKDLLDDLNKDLENDGVKLSIVNIKDGYELLFNGYSVPKKLVKYFYVNPLDIREWNFYQYEAYVLDLRKTYERIKKSLTRLRLLYKISPFSKDDILYKIKCTKTELNTVKRCSDKCYKEYKVFKVINELTDEEKEKYYRIKKIIDEKNRMYGERAQNIKILNSLNDPSNKIINKDVFRYTISKYLSSDTVMPITLDRVFLLIKKIDLMRDHDEKINVEGEISIELAPIIECFLDNVYDKMDDDIYQENKERVLSNGL